MWVGAWRSHGEKEKDRQKHMWMQSQKPYHEKPSLGLYITRKIYIYIYSGQTKAIFTKKQ